MTDIRHHTVIANGIRQHYLEAGTGPTVVLYTGFLKPASLGDSRYRFWQKSTM